MNACALGVFFFLIILKRTIPYRARAVVYIVVRAFGDALELI